MAALTARRADLRLSLAHEPPPRAPAIRGADVLRRAGFPDDAFIAACADGLITRVA